MVVDIKKINNLKMLEVREVSVVGYGANNKKFSMIKNKDGLTERPFWMTEKEYNKITGVEKDMVEIDNKTVDKTVDVNKAAIDAADILRKEQTEKERVAKEAETAKIAKDKLDKEQKDIVAKAVAEKDALAKELLTMKEEARINKEEIAKARQEAKIERDSRVLATKVTFAKEQLGYLGSEEVLGTLVKEAEEVLKPETFKTLLETFKSANEKIKDSKLFSEIGKDTTQTAKGSYERLDKAAKDIMVKDKVDYNTAVSKAVSADSSLYDAYEKSLEGKE